MADNVEGDESAPRGNEWEVVSLTASVYDAAPGPKRLDSSRDIQGKFGGDDEAEASSAMVNSQHFVFPPSQHENLPLDELVGKEEGKTNLEDIENVSIKELMSDEFPGIPMFDQKGNWLSASGADFDKDVILDKDKSISSSAEFHSFHHEAIMDNSNTVEEDEGTADTSLLQDHASDSGLLDSQMPGKEGGFDDSDLPCEAWWKRQAVSLYAQAKEANTFWSIFIAAAVTGLVIIGHRWQQERWHVLHLKWQSSVGGQRMGGLLGPIYRVKDVIVGGHRHGSFLRGRTSTEH